jgi:hypothetical protein
MDMEVPRTTTTATASMSVNEAGILDEVSVETPKRWVVNGRLFQEGTLVGMRNGVIARFTHRDDSGHFCFKPVNGRCPCCPNCESGWSLDYERCHDEEEMALYKVFTIWPEGTDIYLDRTAGARTAPAPCIEANRRTIRDVYPDEDFRYLTSSGEREWSRWLTFDHYPYGAAVWHEGVGYPLFPEGAAWADTFAEPEESPPPPPPPPRPRYPRLQDHFDRPVGGWKPRGRKKPWFGVEVEVEPAGRAEDDGSDVIAGFPEPEDVIFKKDGSLNYGGFEVVSHPASIQWWRRKDVSKWFNYLDEQGYHSWGSNNCGMHVHISRDALTPLQWWRVAKVLSFQWFTFAVSRRKDLSELRSWAYWPMYESPRAYLERVSTSERHRAVNMSNDNTVEIRIFKGTLLPSSFKRNLELVNALLRYAKTSFVSMKHEGASAFLDWMKKPASKKALGKRAHREVRSFLKEVKLCA